MIFPFPIASLTSVTIRYFGSFEEDTASLQPFANKLKASELVVSYLSPAYVCQFLSKIR